MLPQMHLQIAPAIIFFSTPFIMASKLINIVMSSLMVFQNPFLAEISVAAWEGALKFWPVLLIMRSQMIFQMALRLISLITPFKIAFI